MAHYTGVSSVESLYDWSMDKLPARTKLRQASLKNDVASALLFMRYIDAFVMYVLGVKDCAVRDHPEPGLFGSVKAYFGMVETQGGGTLHAHFLVWLTGSYPNNECFERALRN